MPRRQAKREDSTMLSPTPPSRPLLLSSRMPYHDRQFFADSPVKEEAPKISPVPFFFSRNAEKV